MKTLNPQQDPDAKRGIALIVVLGFLSVLLVLAVSFAVSMRVERLAASTFVDVIRTRQLMYSALARAMDDIDQDIGNDIYPDLTAWPDGFLSSSGGDDCPLLATGVALDYVPGSLLTPSLLSAASVQWSTPYVAVGNVTGRYGYVAVDCSGLLDANWVGGLPRAYGTNCPLGSGGTWRQGLARSYGTNVNEISLDANVLTELSSTSDLVYARGMYDRFESVPELWYVGNSAPFPFLDQYPSNLFVYSYFPANQFVVGGTQTLDAVYIGGYETNVVATQAYIQAQFAAMGVTEAQDATRNLIDYIDADHEPGNGAGVESFCTEPVPMINEVVITNIVGSYQDTNTAEDVYFNRLDIRVELWFPFVGYVNSNDYSLSMRVMCDGPNRPVNATFWPRQAPAFLYVPESGLWPGAGGRFRVLTVPSITAIYRTPSAAPTRPELPTNAAFDVKIRQGNSGPSGVLVDGIKPSSFVLQWNTNFVPTVPALGVTSLPVVVRGEANDPRINWDWRNTNHWRLRPLLLDSLGRENGALPYGSSLETNMYVRNRDNLPLVGELGFLLYSSNMPWRTIRLIDDPPSGGYALPVLDRFTTLTNKLCKGLVNPNSLNPAVLSSVLLGAYGERWPGEGSTNVSPAEAQSIAGRMIDAGPYMNLSDIARVTDTGLEAVVSGAFDSMQKEAIIRNTAGLLSTRQNIFMIILVAQMLDKTGSPSSEQRALAVVWRDPFPDSTGRHPSFVRFFKWLTE